MLLYSGWSHALADARALFPSENGEINFGARIAILSDVSTQAKNT